MRFLAIDVGMARSGFAVGSDETGLAAPVGQVEHRHAAGSAVAAARLDAIAEMIERHDPSALVMGLPVNMDGTEGPAAKAMRDLAAEVATRFGKPVHLVDERLSSDVADSRMARSGLTHGQKKARRDSLAAAEILHRFLEQRRAANPPR